MYSKLTKWALRASLVLALLPICTDSIRGYTPNVKERNEIISSAIPSKNNIDGQRTRHRSISSLNPREIEDITDAMNRSIENGYECITDKYGVAQEEKESLTKNLEQITKRLNIETINLQDTKHIRDTALSREFEKKGYVFDVDYSIYPNHGNNLSYLFGKIIKSEDFNGDSKIIYYSSEGFVQNLEYTLSGSPLALLRKGNRIYVDEHMTDILIRNMYQKFQRVEKKGNIKHLVYNPGDIFLFQDYNMIRKKFPKLSENKFVKEYYPKLKKTCLEHEKSHIRHNLPDKVDSETVAFLEQLEKAPAYYAFGILEQNAGFYPYSEVKKRIFNWFEEQGYGRKKLCWTPLKDISKTATNILETKYPYIN